jgi:hypothetical protein
MSNILKKFDNHTKYIIHPFKRPLPERNMKIDRILRISFTICSAFFALNAIAKPKDPEQKIVLHCDVKSSSNAYPDNLSYIKDNPSSTKELFSDKFNIEFTSPKTAIFKHDNDMIADEEYSVIKTQSLYKLKSIKSSEDTSIVIDLTTNNFSAVHEKHDALLRIKSVGNCQKQ